MEIIIVWHYQMMIIKYMLVDAIKVEDLILPQELYLQTKIELIILIKKEKINISILLQEIAMLAY